MNILRSALLPYSAGQMFDIVADIEAYPTFLNWCSQVEVLDNDVDSVIAKMHIAYGKLAFSFITRNVHEVDREIKLDLIDGPFTEFSGNWSFTPLGNQLSRTNSTPGSKILLEMKVKFDRGFASVVMGKMFENIASTQLELFEKRAQALYGISELV